MDYQKYPEWIKDNMKYALLEIQKIIKDCLDEFMKKDIFLLEIGVSERAIMHRLACILQSKIPQNHVDCEYDRKGYNIKRINPDNPQSGKIYPDIIVHDRGNDLKNILAIEIKKCERDGIIEDEQRLKTFTLEQHKYKFGLLIIFNVKEKYQIFPICKWFKDGKKCEL